MRTVFMPCPSSGHLPGMSSIEVMNLTGKELRLRTGGGMRLVAEAGETTSLRYMLLDPGRGRTLPSFQMER